MRRGSALVPALVVIAVLAIIVMSFSVESKSQAGINIYMRERNRINRLVDAGKIIGEMVLLGYKNVKDYSQDENEAELDEEDRWYREKRELKSNMQCKIGPLLIDEDNENSGTVTVEISLANSGAENGININELYEGGDKNYLLRWQMILKAHGVHEDLEVDDEEGRKVNFMNFLIANWNDWRDDDDNKTVIEGEELGAESQWYEERDEEDDIDEEDRRRPRNASIPAIREIANIRGFRDYPAILTGGLLYTNLVESPENPRLKSIERMFGVTGSSKIVITPDTTVEQLLSVPGIFKDDDDDESSESRETAQAILDTLKIKPTGYDVEENRSWWPFKDWQDLKSRVEDEFDVELSQEASEYIEFQISDTSVFKIKITGQSYGMVHCVNCQCYVKDNKVRYITWQED